MPNLQQAKKALRQSEKRALRNKNVKENVSYAVKQVRKAIASGDKAKATEALLTAGKIIDKATQKNILKKNTAARKKSRMHKKVNAMS